MRPFHRIHLLLLALLATVTGMGSMAQDITVTVELEAGGKPISPLLMGVFYEDLNYAADGGLYAELVQNRSFDYGAADHEGWHALTAWDRVEGNGGEGVLMIDAGEPLHPNNPTYAVLGVKTGGDGVGIRNAGFDGIPVTAGERYDFSVFARQLSNRDGPLSVRLESRTGQVLAGAQLPALTGNWKQYTAVLEPAESEPDARLVVYATHPGRIGLDMVSLFPRKTFHNRPNGLRADLAEMIADLKPRFVRFPGGCLVHGDGLDNLYNWKNSIGPVEERRGQRNIWRYHQSLGLGYYEYFQFCEDLGAEPLPVVPAAVSCQHSGASVTGLWGEGQKGIPLEDMPAYVQDVLDLIEWANGPATSEWGAKRAAAGHPEPFGLTYLGVGNEDLITPAFEERFRMIHDAIREAYPDIVVVGTAGPFPDGEDYDKGWALANEMQLELVDEHCYKPPQWFWDHLDRFDAYDRSRAKVYLGEWAAHDERRRTTLRSAIAEAAYFTSLERNGDVVIMTSYAPLLAKHGNTRWNPDLIYFDNTQIHPTINYHVQKLLGQNAGDTYLPTTLIGAEGPFAASTVRDSDSGDTIIKLVNGDAAARPVRLILEGAGQTEIAALATLLAGDDPLAVNDRENPHVVLPSVRPLRLGSSTAYTAPANSLTIIRIPSG